MWRKIGFLIGLTLIVVACGSPEDELENLVAEPPTAAPPTARPTITPRPTETPTLTPTITLTPEFTPTPDQIDLPETFRFADFRLAYTETIVREIAAFYEDFTSGRLTDQTEKVVYDDFPETVVFEIIPQLANGRRGSLEIATVTDELGTPFVELGLSDLTYLNDLGEAIAEETLEEVAENALSGILIGDTLKRFESTENGTYVRGIFYTGDPAAPFDPNELTYKAVSILNIRYHILFEFPVAITSAEVRQAAESAESLEEALAPLGEDIGTLWEPVVTELDQILSAFSAPQLIEPTATPAPPTATATVTPTEEAEEAPTATPTDEATAAPKGTVDLSEVPPNDPDCSHFLIFSADVTIPDGEAFPPGVEIVKVWEAENQGSCTLSSAYTLFPLQETIPIVSIEPVPVVEPNSIGAFEVRLRTPEEPGRYIMNWQLAPPDDGSVNRTEPFGRLYIEIVVDEEAPEPTETP